MTNAKERARTALGNAFAGKKDEKGYVDRIEENLLDGVRLDQFEADLKQGDGNELTTKFRAVHSSSALAVNCFAPYKDKPAALNLLGLSGAKRIQFEKKLPIIKDRKSQPNLDVWIDYGSKFTAVESKLLEYFSPKKPEFADAYKSLDFAPEHCWWSVCEEVWDSEKQFLDVAQLVKHYFGLRRFQLDPMHQGNPPDLLLLYLFWEPSNWRDIEECVQHRGEVEKLAAQVADSSIGFKWMSYPALWQEWSENPNLARHAARLRQRYVTSI